MFSTAEPHIRNDRWDEESSQWEGEDYAAGSDSDGNLRSPLISRRTASSGSTPSMRRHSTLVQDVVESVGSTGIGGGWQLAWKWSETEDGDGKKEGGFKRIYLHEQGILLSRRESRASVSVNDTPAEGEFIQASAIVSQSALYSEELKDQPPVEPAMVHPAETASKGPVWAALLDPGVKRALLIGVGIQILQQLSGINGVLNYTPQILGEAGVEVLLSNLGPSSYSASFLISAFATLLMLPCIGVAMKLMDISGRRRLLLTTIPVVLVSLIILVFSVIVKLGTVVNAAISTACVMVYLCFFVMGYGPNILCSEIFPMRVRGLCIAICVLIAWIGDIIVSYTMPMMLSPIGLVGIFGLYAVVCVVSWVFVFLKVPETKGMPLEVITEFFAVGARQAEKNE
ncbi:Monosaccharide-sensing protein 1 [Hibiscus syriacus]|uniref:Monosaccharide-sensing protein 1 n=2 Tax=Hibiscus syriacus TaxID=106335 RepID=A0A6A2W9M8_HIBSY|nr:Monosaccharide-sensing protein 1 [Hibiscus syriacus]